MAGAAGRVGVYLQRPIDRFKNAGEITVDFVIPKAENPEPVDIELCVTCSIPQLMGIDIVLPTIELNDQLPSETDKVDDEFAARCLSTKMITAFPP